MNIDTKLPAFKSFMAETKLNNGGVKTTIDQSAVAAGEQTDVSLNLNSEEEKNGSSKNKKKNKNQNSLDAKKSEIIQNKKSENEVKSLNMKLLNLI